MNKRIVVTGSTKGIGNGLAREFLKRDCRVTISGRSSEVVNEVRDQLAETYGGSKVTGKACEITNAEQIQQLWEHASDCFGEVDVWINNAGVSVDRKPLWQQDTDKLVGLINTNLTGTILASKVANSNMLKQGHGQVWNTEGFGSDGSTQAGMAAYGASKRAIRYLQKALLKDTTETPIQVCTISPGIVVTDLLIGDYDLTSEEWHKSKRFFNILGDHVHTVTPWLADQILTTDKTATRVAWLTRRKAAARFLIAPFKKRDLFDSIG